MGREHHAYVRQRERTPLPDFSRGPRVQQFVASTWKSIVQRWLLLLLLAILWEASGRWGWVDPWLLPPLTAILARGWVLLRNGQLAANLAASAWRVVVGFGLAAGLAFPLGILLGLYPSFEKAIATLLSLLRPLSPPAWIPLAILWFGLGDPPAVFIIFVGTFFSLLVGTLAATRAVDAQWVKTALTLGASRRQAVRYAILPGLSPALLAQTRIGMGLAWMCVIAAEMVAVRRGIGFMMIEARNLFRIDDVLVGMMAVGLIGLGTDRLLGHIERRVCRWQVGLSSSRMYERAGEWS